MKEDSAKMDNPEREKKLMDVLKSAQVISLTRKFKKNYCHIKEEGETNLLSYLFLYHKYACQY
jgi:hypothetical protein